jgi:hypothetical protein
VRVFSVSYERGRSMAERRQWFPTRPAAWKAIAELTEQGARRVSGPHTHEVNGAKGLASILNEYAGDNTEF